jgi:glycosyl transferase family 1
MRILHAPVNIAGQPWVLSRALRRLGHTSDVLVDRHHEFGYPDDIVFNYDDLGSPWRQLRKGAGLLRLIQDYDVFHFYFGDSLFAKHRDLPILRRMRRQVVFHFRGCEIRLRHGELAKHGYCACSDCPAPCATDSEKEALAAVARRMADRILVSTPDLLEWVPEAELVTQACDLSAMPSPTSPEEHERIIVLHAPTAPLIKGTSYVQTAIRNLRAAGYAVELQLIQGKPHSEVCRAIDEADIVVDQLLVGWYGNFAIEAMARGRPVIAYVRDDLRTLSGFSPPIVSATPATIEESLARLIDDVTLRRSLAAEGRPYVERTHDAERIARQLLALYGTP